MGTTSTAGPSLIDRTALVTGSTSGIGAAIARQLAADGAHVVSGQDRLRLRLRLRGDGVIEEIVARGGRANFVPIDLAGSHEELWAFADTALSVLGGQVDILVNNAGIYPVEATEDLSDTDLDARPAIKVRAPLCWSPLSPRSWPSAGGG